MGTGDSGGDRPSPAEGAWTAAGEPGSAARLDQAGAGAQDRADEAQAHGGFGAVMLRFSTAAGALTPVPFKARGQWPNRSIRRQSRQACCAARQPYERASAAAGRLAWRVRELSEHLDRMA